MSRCGRHMRPDKFAYVQEEDQEPVVQQGHRLACAERCAERSGHAWQTRDIALHMVQPDTR
eukprot:949701-Amphidinium_carterae.1